ncbi:ribbon-helix-helix protein, CopG family [Proteocatella sphenisci]|uniref:ribbon-helix-helix protein, CopG family n=1 Tax=Proteocatella sphenisci TaxID=181070 RepID=UPI0004B98305|nr:ribbon-helix-helix protein, CopG family [Proteocatella sphenisci]
MEKKVSTEKKRVTIYMEKETLEKLKIKAIKEGTSASALVEKIVKEMLDRDL